MLSFMCCETLFKLNWNLTLENSESIYNTSVSKFKINITSILNKKLFPPHISCSSLLCVTCTISSQSSLLDPLNHLRWSFLLQSPVDFSLKITNCSFLHAAPNLLNKFYPTLCVPYQSQLFSIIRLWSWTGCWHFSWHFPLVLKSSFSEGKEYTLCFKKRTPKTGWYNFIKIDHHE